MSRRQRLTLCLIGFGLGAAGVYLMLDELSWQALAGLALILWGNNLSQNSVE